MKQRIIKRTYRVDGFLPEDSYIWMNKELIPDILEYPFQMSVWVYMALSSDQSRTVTRSMERISQETGVKLQDTKKAVRELIRKGYLTELND